MKDTLLALLGLLQSNNADKFSDLSREKKTEALNILNAVDGYAEIDFEDTPYKKISLYGNITHPNLEIKIQGEYFSLNIESLLQAIGLIEREIDFSLIVEVIKSNSTIKKSELLDVVMSVFKNVYAVELQELEDIVNWKNKINSTREYNAGYYIDTIGVDSMQIANVMLAHRGSPFLTQQEIKKNKSMFDFFQTILDSGNRADDRIAELKGKCFSYGKFDLLSIYNDNKHHVELLLYDLEICDIPNQIRENIIVAVEEYAKTRNN